VKLKNLQQKLGSLGWYLLRQGKHEIWTNGIETLAVPRHKEIDEFTAKSILRSALKFAIKRKSDG
jgi:mRNA interferase HicA